VLPDGLASHDDLSKLPTWDVHDQRESIEAHPPFGSHYTLDELCDIAYILSTSGTTGVPRLVPVTRRDVLGMQDVMARCFQCLGLGPGDLIQVTFTYATMAAAWACTWAAEGAGVGIVPASSGRTTPSDRQIDLIRRAGVTAIVGTPSYILHLAEAARSDGYDPSTWKVRTIITAGEISSPGTRAALERAWGARVYDLYGTVDTLSWSCLDCEASRQAYGRLGMHVWEDTCLIEALDPDGNPVSPGEYGEMCITSWVWRSSPRIRFRTGDAVAVVTEPCECGSTLARLLPVAGRVDDMLRIHAQNIFPMAIENALQLVLPDIKEWLVEAVTTEKGDRLLIRVERPTPHDAASRERLEREVRRTLNLEAASVALVPPGATAAMTGAGTEPKVRRVFDRRRRSAPS
jgi:phenylacetate-CoA ligase